MGKDKAIAVDIAIGLTPVAIVIALHSTFIPLALEIVEFIIDAIVNYRAVVISQCTERKAITFIGEIFRNKSHIAGEEIFILLQDGLKQRIDIIRTLTHSGYIVCHLLCCVGQVAYLKLEVSLCEFHLIVDTLQQVFLIAIIGDAELNSHRND